MWWGIPSWFPRTNIVYTFHQKPFYLESLTNQISHYILINSDLSCFVLQTFSLHASNMQKSIKNRHQITFNRHFVQENTAHNNSFSLADNRKATDMTQDGSSHMLCRILLMQRKMSWVHRKISGIAKDMFSNFLLHSANTAFLPLPVWSDMKNTTDKTLISLIVFECKWGKMEVN